MTTFKLSKADREKIKAAAKRIGEPAAALTAPAALARTGKHALQGVSDAAWAVQDVWRKQHGT